MACWVQVGAGGRERDAVVKLGDRDVQAEVREPLHVRLHVARDLAEDEVALEADAVERHALRQQRLREAEHRVALGVLALDVEVVQVQLRVRVGGVRGPQRVGDVAAAHRVEERVRHERPVAVERLVDHVPRVALALVVGGLGGDVGLHRRLHLASRQGGHPRGELALPDQVVTAHPLAVRLGIGDDLVARAEVERAVGRLGGVPLHLVARRDHVELLGLELGHRRLGQQVSGHVTAEVPAACRLGERLQGRPWRQRRLRGVLPIASVAMAATVAVMAPAANIRRRDALPGDLVASGARRDRHIFMASSSSKVIGESCDNCMK